jgi:phosphomannomutase
MTEIKFGTDGWRAVIAEGFTFANVELVAQATADYWNDSPAAGTVKKVIIGYDRRFLSDQFASTAAQVFAGNGFQVLLNREPTPTPAISLAVKAHRAVGGVVVTASHNPPAFNGFKLKAHFGGSADQAICQQVEALLRRNPVKSVDLQEALRAQRITLLNLRGEYLRAVKTLVDFPLIAQSKLRFAHEALFGVGAGCFDELLTGTTLKVSTMNSVRYLIFVCI